MNGDRYPSPDEYDRVGSGPCVRHNLTGREILVLNGVDLPCPGTTALRTARLAREAELAAALEAIGWA